MRLPRIYPILDTATLLRRGCENWSGVARAMLEGGARIVQFRHKGTWTPAVLAQAETIAGDCRQAGAAFVVNDRADFAKLLEAGLHTGQDDLQPTDCRIVIGYDALLGFSTHNAGQLVAADSEPVDYLAFGPVFETASKENPDPVAGLALLEEIRSDTRKPLVAIGGIRRETAWRAFAAGADSVAIIADLLPGTLQLADIRRRMEEWQILVRE